ncbi:MAG: hypothetical protein KKD90_04390 [Candidatus Omnitrophica bacterium]|nr:hypothetical protein [Candidatus Omnitrophota bacterium]
MIKMIKNMFILLVIVTSVFLAFRFYLKYSHENKILKEIISRLEADSRIAEVLVTGVNYDENTGKSSTTIKFLEYDARNNPMTPRYFTFSGNIIQFQSLVIRFEDIHVRMADRLRGKSAYLFWKVFMLDGLNTQEYDITKAYGIPGGYKLEGKKDSFEKELWARFWEQALNPAKAKKSGIKNAQIEAPGTMFIPGMLYTIKIEHDGGMRIDAIKLPDILKGEKIPR